MVSFARARTRSLLSRLWPVTGNLINNKAIESNKPKKQNKDIAEQNKCFLEASKNGGMWFS